MRPEAFDCSSLEGSSPVSSVWTENRSLRDDAECSGFHTRANDGTPPMMLRGQRSFSSGALIKRLSHRRLNKDHVPCKSVPSFWRAIGKVPENGLDSIFITPPRNVGHARAGTPARPDLNEPTMTSHGCDRVRHCHEQQFLFIVLKLELASPFDPHPLARGCHVSDSDSIASPIFCAIASTEKNSKWYGCVNACRFACGK
jgi:hypothetical protein